MVTDGNYQGHYFVTYRNLESLIYLELTYCCRSIRLEGKKEDQSAAAAVRDCHQSFLVFLPLKISLSMWKTDVIVLVSCTLGWCCPDLWH